MTKIKILQASNIYNEYINRFYNTRPQLKYCSYSEQYNFLCEDKFSWIGLWKNKIEKSGNIDYFEVLFNNSHLQKKWAQEANLIFDENNWLLSILYQQINTFKPDVLFVHDNAILKGNIIDEIRKNHSFIKVVVGYDGIALNDLSRFKSFDLVLSCLESTAQFYTHSKTNIQGLYFPLAFDSSVIDELGSTINKNIPFSFIGSLVKGAGYHNQRIESITKLLQKTPLELFSSGLDEPYEIYRFLQRKRLVSFKWKELWQFYLIGKNTKPAVYGMEMYKTLASSKITFNSHIDRAQGKAANMRLFEATGVGTCLMTDYMDNLKDFFDTENDIVTYKSVDECIDKVTYLLNNQQVIEKIAASGQKKTLTHHIYENRINSFENKLMELL